MSQYLWAQCSNWANEVKRPWTSFVFCQSDSCSLQSHDGLFNTNLPLLSLFPIRTSPFDHCLHPVSHGVIHPSSLHPTLLFDSSIYRSYQVMTWRDMMAVQRNLSSCPQSCIEFWENPVSCIDFQSSCSLHEQVVCLVFTGQRRHNEEIRVNGRTAGGSDPLWTSEGRLVK